MHSCDIQNDNAGSTRTDTQNMKVKDLKANTSYKVTEVRAKIFVKQFFLIS